MGGSECLLTKRGQHNLPWLNRHEQETILVVYFRPFYLPREFGQLTIILVYVPGPNNKEATECISDSLNTVLSRSADQPVFILGDFNTLSLAILIISQCYNNMLTVQPAHHASLTYVMAILRMHIRQYVDLPLVNQTIMSFIYCRSTDNA